MSSRIRLNRPLTALAVPALLFVCSVAYAATGTEGGAAKVALPKIRLDMPAQDLSSALTQFGRETGTEIVFSPDAVRAKKAVAIKGEFERDQALKFLLQGTGLKYRATAQGAIIVEMEGSKSISDAATLSLMQGDDHFRAAESNAAAQINGSDRRLMDDGVERMIVEDQRIKPFSDRNVDLPRTINDEQPYYIFDSETIERSGATNLETFLLNRLTMNASYGAASQRIDGGTNVSSINLRGLGATHTLILVNGRRLAAVTEAGVDKQTDLNGIPLSAIERIEVLPTSSSGIYGGSALGGVINVILKKEYTGGEVRASYRNTWDNAAPAWNFSGSFGASLEEGRTTLMLTGHYSKADPLELGAREAFFDRYLQRVLRIPNWLYSSAPYSPVLGALPNIGVACCSTAPLTLKSGVALNSQIATLPAGYSATSNPSGIIPGQWNNNYSEGTRAPTGRSAYLSPFPRTQSVMATLRRKMHEKLELYVEGMHTENHSSSDENSIYRALDVPGTLANNPFQQTVNIAFPTLHRTWRYIDSNLIGVTLGGVLDLPREWRMQFDYSWSHSDHTSQWMGFDSTAFGAAVISGQVNPFVDTLMYPLDIARFFIPRSFDNQSDVAAVSMRGSGPLVRLPWGSVRLTGILEHSKNSRPDNYFAAVWPLTPASDQHTTYFAQSSKSESAYLEATVPLVSENHARPLLKILELQLAARGDRYTVDAGALSYTVFPNRTPPLTSYSGPTLNGDPYRFETNYFSTNKTLALRYKPLSDLTLRLSGATAFVPPTYSQLLPNPLPNATSTTAIDRRNPLMTPPPSGCANSGGFTRCPYQNFSGGNPYLKPQSSKSFNAGAIWEPNRDLRLNLEYYRIDQFDKIGSLSVQQMIDVEDVYPDRIVRDPNTGLITLVDRSLVNLSKLETGGWDLSADYRLGTALGEFGLYAGATMIAYERRQNTINSPLLDYVGYVNSGGEGKYKANATFDWQRGGWAMGWTVRYFDSYWQTGAPGDPQGTSTYYTNAQGALSIPSQVYHDVFASYSFGRNEAARQRGLSRLLSDFKVQMVITNALNTYPPFDILNNSYYYSYYGDVRLRDYTLSFTKGF